MRTNIFKEKLFWVILISVLIGFIIFEIFNESLNNLDSFLKLLTVLVSCLTFGLAYLLFDKYGLKKNVIERQFDAVVDLIHSLRKLQITYEVVVKSGDIECSKEWGRIIISTDMSSYRKPHFIDKRKYEVFVNPNDFFDGTKEISRSLSNIWLPVQLRETFKILEVGIFIGNKESLERPHVKLFLFQRQLSVANNKDFSRIGENEILFEDFIDKLESCIAECETWINKYADYNFKLNI